MEDEDCKHPKFRKLNMKWCWKRRRVGVLDEVPAPRSSSKRSQQGGVSLPTKNTPTPCIVVEEELADPTGSLGMVLLFSPPKPKVDLVFVHGLGGGSRRTWSKTESPAHYWPREWLPKDPSFEYARVHSYGYDSNYAKGRENCLNVHHFGKSLLVELSSSPSIAASDTPIVLIGHSMGGLVIKKAWILASQEVAHRDFAKRITAFFFLATPHRGADWAIILHNIIRVAYDRAYVADLFPDSEAVQDINNQFRQVSDGVELWSFYETQRMRLPPSLIVEPQSATLGYPGEKQMPMNADHRSICKFESPFDPNYLILRNTLALTVGRIVKSKTISMDKLRRGQIQKLQAYFGLPETFDDDLLVTKNIYTPGSCEWLTAGNAYTEWETGTSNDNRILWINGKPGAGKSFLTGHVIERLQDAGKLCSYFMFKHSDKSKSRLSTGLRSLAIQMAALNPEALRLLQAVRDSGSPLDQNNERAIWKVLFLSGILQATTPHQFWVIDGLDECEQVSFFLDTIMPELGAFPRLRILFTSRNISEISNNLLGIERSHIRNITISVEDTLPDIKRLIKTKVEGLAIMQGQNRDIVVENILKMSRGSFVWTNLVLQGLQNSHSTGDVAQVLTEVPRGMRSLYQRALDTMSQRLLGKQLTQHILMWVTCAFRPLTVSELDAALRLDIKDEFPGLMGSIDTLCGQLITVEASGKVQVVHETAREFLLDKDLCSEFAVDEQVAHTRMAVACLSYLVGDDMKPPRMLHYRRTAVSSKERSEFSVYASVAYLYHLSKADPRESQLLSLAERFLKANVLSWIEIVAVSKNLGQLSSASGDLKQYLDTCRSAEHEIAPGLLEPVDNALTDLVDIATRFGDVLVSSPSSIYSLIPAFCPKSSMIFNTTYQGKRLSVIGASNNAWDNRLFVMDYLPVQPAAVAYGNKFLAVGLPTPTGEVRLYDVVSYQDSKVLHHGEPVGFVKFGRGPDVMASCGYKLLKVWNTTTGTVTYNVSLPHRPLDLTFDKSRLLVASQGNYAASWDLEKGGRQAPNRYWSDQQDPGAKPLGRAPRALTISASHSMVAIAYSFQPITLWDLSEDAYFGTCGKKLSSGATSKDGIVSLLFNPDPDTGLLAASYLDGDLVIIDPFADEQLACTRTNCQTLTASPDGRLLAGGGPKGRIQVYEFRTLNLVYSIEGSDSYIRGLSFNPDSRCLVDIRSSQCTVWESPTQGWVVGTSNGSTTSRPLLSAAATQARSKITVMAMQSALGVMLCGRIDGAVDLYSLKTASYIRTLYRHKTTVRLLNLWESGETVMSIDASGRILVYSLWKLEKLAGLETNMPLLDARLESEQAVVGVLVSESIGKFILNTRESDYLWNMSGEEEVARARQTDEGVRRWALHPRSELLTICLDQAELRVHRWDDLSVMWSSTLMQGAAAIPQQPKSIHFCRSDSRTSVLLEWSERDGPPKTTQLTVLDAEAIPVEAEETSLQSQMNVLLLTSLAEVTSDAADLSSPVHWGDLMGVLEGKVAHCIGVRNPSRLNFLDQASWVCSVDIEQVTSTPSGASHEYTRHFFVPYEWLAGTRDVLCAVANDSMVFARGGELSVVERGFKFAESVCLDRGMEGVS